MLNTIKKAVKQGCSNQFDEETNRRIAVINIFTAVGVSLPLCFGIYSLFISYWSMGILLLLISGSLVVARALTDPAHPPSEQPLPSSILIGSLFALMTLLIVTGGHDNTGVMWIYIMPPVALFFGGLWVGSIITGIFLCTISVLLFYPDNQLLQTTYSLSFKIRFLLSLLTTVLFSAVYEYTRQRSIQRIQNLNDKFEHLAMHDVLTELPNRRFIQEELNRELARSERNKSPLSIVLCDIDKFKQVNDTYGHECGDQILRYFARTLNESVRKQDLVARWGGEEFLIILPDTPGESAEHLAESVRQKLERSQYHNGEISLNVTASFGVCELESGNTTSQALSDADEALYVAKRQGRNRVVNARRTSIQTEQAPGDN